MLANFPPLSCIAKDIQHLAGYVKEFPGAWDGMGFLVGLAPLGVSGVSGVSGLGEKGCCCWHRIASLTLST